LGRAGYHGWYGLEADARLADVNDDPIDSVRRSLERLGSLLPTAKRL